MLGIVVPTRTDAYARRFLRSLATCEPELDERTKDEEFSRVVLVENGLSDEFTYSLVEAEDGIPELNVEFVRYPHHNETEHRVRAYAPFIFARAINLGVAALDPRADLLLVNDDTEFMSQNPITALETLLASPAAQGYGIISPRIVGGAGNPDLKLDVPAGEIHESQHAINFIAVLIPRAVWDIIGPMDERYTAYGGDDLDASRRAVNAGYKLGVTGSAVMRHIGDGRREAHGTFGRLYSDEELKEKLEAGFRQFYDKWGDA